MRPKAQVANGQVLSYRHLIARWQRFRPLKLSWMAHSVARSIDLYDILRLFSQLFPAEYCWQVERRPGRVCPDDVYGAFLKLVDRDLFPVSLWDDYWDHKDRNFLYIPLYTFGWRPDELTHGDGFNDLYVLLISCLWPDEADTQWENLVRLGVDAEALRERVGDGIDVHRTVERLAAQKLPPPISYLADALYTMADATTGTFHNVYTGIPHIYLGEYFSYEPPTWDDDHIAWLSAEWAVAKPALEHTWALAAACEQFENTSQFMKLIAELVLGDPPDRELLDHLRRAAEAAGEEEDFSRHEQEVREENHIW